MCLDFLVQQHLRAHTHILIHRQYILRRASPLMQLSLVVVICYDGVIRCAGQRKRRRGRARVCMCVCLTVCVGWGGDDLPPGNDRVRTHLFDDDDFITSWKINENMPPSSPPLRPENKTLPKSKERRKYWITPLVMLHEGFFFCFVLFSFAWPMSGGSAGRALFAVAIDLPSLFRQPPRPV